MSVIPNHLVKTSIKLSLSPDPLFWTNHGRPGNHSDPHKHPYNPSTGKKGPAQPIYPPDMV